MYGTHLFYKHILYDNADINCMRLQPTMSDVSYKLK